MAGRFVRASRVRHVFCEPAKAEEQYHNLRLSSATGDHNYIKANETFFAVPVQTGGGSLAVVPLSQCGKLPPCLPVLDGHRGAVLDFEFNPFHETIIATGGDDCTIKIWGLPEGGLTENLMEPLVNMAEHQKKVSVLRFHPSADSVLASGSADGSVKLWDVQRGEAVTTCDEGGALVQDLVWNYDGSVVASSSKDKQVRLLDPRSGAATATVQAHDGAKTSKLTFLGARGSLCSVGFTRASKRQFKIWDPRDLSAPVTTADIDQAAGVIMPFYDEGTNLLYLAGKGEASVRFYEITGEAPWQHHISDYRGSSPARGMAMVPKRACDVGRCEVARFLKLTTDTVEPLSFICPRKSDSFQSDLFPDCPAPRPACTADAFFSGTDSPPVLMSMDPDARRRPQDDSSDAGASQGEPAHAFRPSKPARELEEELRKANAYIVQLQARLQENDIQVPAPAC